MIQQLEVDAVRPAEADRVLAVAEADVTGHVGVAPPQVVLLHERPGALEVPGHERYELASQAIGVRLVCGAAQAALGDELQRRPAERRIPLASARGRARQ